jgi:hypothetical protein
MVAYLTGQPMYDKSYILTKSYGHSTTNLPHTFAYMYTIRPLLVYFTVDILNWVKLH